MRWYKRQVARVHHSPGDEIRAELETWLRQQRRRHRWRVVRGFPLRVVRWLGRLLLR